MSAFQAVGYAELSGSSRGVRRDVGAGRTEPPQATWDPMETTAASVLKGDTDRGSMVERGFRAKVREFPPGREKK
ncbi:hypothetical protein AB0E85_02800 [Streptomyces sp. NPDC029044]|uniref:hypothetical protein n=1 Tax=Streptomyces sp. NPDC029044 TaxID=3157198 RepID=UPI003405F210